MKSSSCALAAVLAALCVPAWSQVGDGPVAPMTAPPTIYSSAPPSVAVRPMGPPPVSMRPATPPPVVGIRPAPPGTVAAPAAAPQRPGMFAAASVATATRLTTDAREERRFLREAAAQSRFELDASTLVFSKSANGAVRSLAASLINHNKTAGLELAHLLHSRGMAMPMMSNEQRKALNQLAKLTGGKLDAVYMQQVGLHQGAVARDYEKAGAAIREPQISAWIAKTLPTTRYHLMLAERAVPADPQAAKWNRALMKPTMVKAPAAMPQLGATPSFAPPPGRIAVQPVVTNVGASVSGSGIQ